jgi:hypothetical protein
MTYSTRAACYEDGAACQVGFSGVYCRVSVIVDDFDEACSKHQVRETSLGGMWIDW